MPPDAIEPAHGAPTSYWQSTPPPAGRRLRRALLGVAWIAAIALAGFFALLAYRTSSGSEEFRQGKAIGALLAPFLFALVLRFIWVLVITRSRPGPRSVVRSPWIPFGAVLLIGLNFIGNASSFLPPSPVDPSTAVRISGPYTVRDAPPEALQIAEQLQSSKTFRSFVLREVAGEDGSVSYMLVADGALRNEPGAINEVARGIEDATGSTATIESIRDHDVALVVAESGSAGTWIESPLLFQIDAADEPTLRSVIDAVLSAPRT